MSVKFDAKNLNVSILGAQSITVSAKNRFFVVTYFFVIPLQTPPPHFIVNTGVFAGILSRPLCGGLQCLNRSPTRSLKRAIAPALAELHCMPQ
jgi:hypothetical protein